MIKSKKIIFRADLYLDIDNHRQIKDAFLEKYTKCEVLCRPIVQKYIKEKGIHISDSKSEMDLTLIKKALQDAGFIFIDNRLLTRIWGKSQAKGSSSCRFLRNKILHELMERALHEVVERADILNADMDMFIELLMNN